MSATPRQRAAIREAAMWYTRLNADAVTADEHRAWATWHAADPLHREAWSRLEALCGQFSQLPAPVATPTLLAPPPTRRSVLGALLAVASAGALGGLLAGSDNGRAWLADLRTRTGERRRFTLADGSQLLLDTASAVDVHFDARHRRLDLRAGALLVSTAADPAGRPFRVHTPHGQVRALGTRFSVRLDADSTRVVVLEQRVEITPQATDSAPLRLEAGQQARFDAGRSQPAEPSAAGATAWASGSLVALNQPLGQLLAELARYRPGLLDCDPRIAGLAVSGAFPLDDTDLALGALENAFPVRQQRRTRYWVTLVPR